MQKLLLYDISINSYTLLNTDTYGIEIHFAEIRALKDCNLCANLWINQGGKNVPQHSFSSIYSLKNVFVMTLFGVMNI